MIKPYVYYRIKESIRGRDDSFNRVYRKNRQLLDEAKKAKIELKEKTKEIVDQWKMERKKMKASELIKELVDLIAIKGDLEVSVGIKGEHMDDDVYTYYSTKNKSPMIRGEKNESK